MGTRIDLVESKLQSIDDRMKSIEDMVKDIKNTMDKSSHSQIVEGIYQNRLEVLERRPNKLSVVAKRE